MIVENHCQPLPARACLGQPASYLARCGHGGVCRWREDNGIYRPRCQRASPRIAAAALVKSGGHAAALEMWNERRESGVALAISVVVASAPRFASRKHAPGASRTA